MTRKKTTERQGFKIGEFVVYPAHGLGQVVSIDEQEVAGTKLELLSPVARECVVELVGLEPTTKVLWNMVRVRPTPLVGHPCRSPRRFTVLLDFPGFLILESTTRALWNMVRVRPTILVGHTHPDRRALLFS